ncbi:TetR/AcrR family transcriptional regulator [Sedimentibacter sp. zth1]|uniref:TetR/AcrR family transcriptional regulator n=1 Tax=Sedimentibacter sp. zth1 TaxID=2816908 RepID=UPI001A91FA79|nr:TetR/AcrR family transcriptional regulator [Sedimentibacter sp. zth1]QSX06261.1 TetR/AcrR family transcriptional regulator [Sedimentibacter sp. zth1]
MRVSKEPEIRKREMIDTAMKIFAWKGYEGTTMADIAKAMNVVPGLCYRYFKSKHKLYLEAVSVYAKECIVPMIAIMQKEEISVNKYLEQFSTCFIARDGKEKYHDFFHGQGNDMFNKQLAITMCDALTPYVTEFIICLNKKGMLHVENPGDTARFVLYGEIPILNDETLNSEEKADKIMRLIRKIMV